MDTKETIQVNSESVFNVKDLSVSYGDFVAIKNVNMDITKNKITAFIGPSGCGKSTLIRTCLLYTSPSPRDEVLSRMPSSA